MIGGLILLAALQQGPGLQVLTSLNHDRVVPGDEVVLTVRAVSRSIEPIQINVPSLTGFALLARVERSEVLPGTPPSRSSVLELRLRAKGPGEYRLGPFLARQGREYAQADAVNVTVEGSGSAASTALNPRLRQLLDRAPPPPALGEAAVSVIVSADSVVVGDQVDVVTVAWFDREIRQQLRRAPTVEAPRIEGVWSYPQPVPGGIAASRMVNGRWYDLFVLYQVVFPLTPGRVVVSPARLQYSLPLAFQFFSQEERYTLTSESGRFRAQPVPEAGRPIDFAGAIGTGIGVAQSLTPPTGRQGEAFTLDITLSGNGNVGLWPLPPVVWPAGIRAYPEGSREGVTARGGRFGGSKTFRFLLVPDSAGTTVLRPLRYVYFDPAARQYQTATAPALQLAVAPAREGHASRPLPAPLQYDRRRPAGTAARHAVPDSVWLLVLALPPLGYAVTRVRWRRRRRPAPSPAVDPVGDAERRLEAALARLVEDPVERELGLRDALARIGLEPGLAGRLGELRIQIRTVRYAGEGAPAVGEGLVRRIDEALAALAARPARRRARARMLVIALLALGPAEPLLAQSPEDLYEAGAFRAAGDGFARRAAAAPLVPANWFNLGAARYREGDDAAALAAWINGARLRPRDPALRRSLDAVPPADAGAGRWLWTSPASPDELWTLAALAWLFGWAGLIHARRVQGRWVVLLTGAVLIGAFAFALERWYARPVAVSRTAEPLRVSPHELASPLAQLPRLSVVEVRSGRGPWYEIRDPEGRRGWVTADALVRVGP